MNRAGIIKNRTVFDAWLVGKTVQYRMRVGDDWRDIDQPSWVEYYEYRVKPEPREFYINIYDDGWQYLHETASSAAQAFSSRSRYAGTTIKVREVLE